MKTEETVFSICLDQLQFQVLWCSLWCPENCRWTRLSWKHYIANCFNWGVGLPVHLTPGLYRDKNHNFLNMQASCMSPFLNSALPNTEWFTSASGTSSIKMKLFFPPSLPQRWDLLAKKKDLCKCINQMSGFWLNWRRGHREGEMFVK